MNFLQKISPGYNLLSQNDVEGLPVLRERILQSMLLLFVVMGIPIVILASQKDFAQGKFLLPTINLTFYLIIVLIAVIRRIPYTVRANALLAVVYLLALSQLLESGQMGEIRMFLVVYIALAAVFFDRIHVLLSIGLSLVTIIVLGVAASMTPQPVIPIIANLQMGTEWVTSSVMFLMISLIISGAISMIINGLDTNLKKQANLMESLENERSMLEDRIQERTTSMSRRLVQLHTAAEISRTISALGSHEKLLQQVVDLIKERFDLYYVGIFLMESTREYAVLQAGTGDAGRRMLTQGHQLNVGGSSMIGWSIANRKARIALDVGLEAVRFNNPNLPLTRSELALPIIVRGNVLGAMTIQSSQPNAFDENDITVLESITDSLAVALENDRLYHEARENLDEIRALNHEYLQRAWAETMETYGDLSYNYENQASFDENRPASTIQVPLTLRDEVIGYISLEMNQPVLSEEETIFMDHVTTQTAIALENARLLQETERRAAQEQKLNELTTRFSRAMSIDEILRTAAQELGQLPAVAEVSVQLDPNMPAGRSTPAMSYPGSSERAA